MTKQKQAPGAPMTLGNMQQPGVKRLIISCLNPECLRGALLDVSAWPAETAVPSFTPRMVCSKCGSKRIDVGRNWKEQPPLGSLTGTTGRDPCKPAGCG
jgi:hypothetical protein